MPEDEIELSIVMPCLDEADTLELCLGKAMASLEELGVAGEVIVADNGSEDGSLEIAERCGARVVPVPERGYGAALMGGIRAARGRFVLMGDADDSYDFSHIGPFLERLRAGDELVMGCRLPGGGGQVAEGAMPWSHRRIGNPFFTALARRLFGMPTHDVYCGLRGFTRDLYDRLDLRCTGMEFATEMVIKASLFGRRIGEVPITLHPDGRVSHPPHLRTLSDGLRTLRFFLLYTPRWLFAAPALALLAAGLAGFVLLLPGPLTLAGARLDVHTLLVAGLALVVGHELLVFGVFTRFFATLEGLAPPSRWAERLARPLVRGTGVWLGLALAAAGLLLLGWQTLTWARTGFGDLDYPTTMRAVIPAVILVALGVQSVFSSFLFGILALKRSRGASPAA